MSHILSIFSHLSQDPPRVREVHKKGGNWSGKTLAFPAPVATLKQDNRSPTFQPSSRDPSVRRSLVLVVLILGPTLQAVGAEPPAMAVVSSRLLGIGPATAASAEDARLKRVPHRIELVDPVAPTSPPQARELIELVDEKGFPAGYELSFVTHVCNDNQCLPVEATLNWDALGYYRRLTYPPGKPLTKKEHVPFTPADYAKLDRILRNRTSILRDWTVAFLEKPPEAADPNQLAGIDAVTAPTPTTVKDSVIEDAAYTSWALWHWANGKIVPKLRQITEKKCTPAYLKHLLGSDERRHVDYALGYVIEHHAADGEFVPDVVRILEKGERDQIPQAIDFLEGAIPDKAKFHARLIESCARMNPADVPIILQTLAADPNLPPATLEALTGHLKALPYFPVHLILRILEQRHFASEKSLADVAGLLDSSDFFVARRACEHLADEKLDESTQAKVDAFREKNRDRL